MHQIGNIIIFQTLSTAFSVMASFQALIKLLWLPSKLGKCRNSSIVQLLLVLALKEITFAQLEKWDMPAKNKCRKAKKRPFYLSFQVATKHWRIELISQKNWGLSGAISGKNGMLTVQDGCTGWLLFRYLDCRVFSYQFMAVFLVSHGDVISLFKFDTNCQP